MARKRKNERRVLRLAIGKFAIELWKKRPM